MSASEFLARFDQAAQNFTRSQAWSASDDSEGDSHDTMAGNRSRTSLYSYRSMRDIANFVQEIGGRTYNSRSDLYLLPSDPEEWNRLRRQHEVLKIGMGGRYPDSDLVHTILASTDGSTKSILDIGCGTGIWAVEMATEFPHSTVLGVDLAPCPLDSTTTPDNFHFELDNIDLGLVHFFNRFDYVQIRGISMGLSDSRRIVDEALQCLHPGGLLLIGEFSWTVYDDDRVTPLVAASEENSEGSWLQRILSESRDATINNGSDMMEMATVLEDGLASFPLADPTTCQRASLYVPIGPPAEATPQVQRAGALTEQHMKAFHRSVHRLLQQHGVSEQDVTNWSSKADGELSESNGKTWVRYNFAWGRRREENPERLEAASPEQDGTLDEPAATSTEEAEEPQGTQGSSHQSPTAPPASRSPLYPYFVVYESQTEPLDAEATEPECSPK
ncbi:S-adenosyl-L-methionine-dependent methyltransferase [Serendipita vermifera]|nr:S-adenosyl-L-methionine-dependent methyltransferase [Serendipita vermifera]